MTVRSRFVVKWAFLLVVMIAGRLELERKQKLISSCEDPWCEVVGTELTCGGTGTLAQTVVYSAGCYNSYTKATLLEGLEIISRNAFLYCWNLREVTVATSVHTFEWGSFPECPITSFTFHQNVKSISPGMFNVNRGMMSLTIHPDNPYYYCENGIIFTKGGDEMIMIASGLKECTIPSTVSQLSTSCCRWSSIENIEIPDTVTSIEDEAFYGSSLRTISIGAGLTSLASGCFGGCAFLESITLSSSNHNFYLENGIFGARSSSTKTSILFINKDVEEANIASSITVVSSFAFQMAESMTKVTHSGGHYTTSEETLILHNGILVGCVGGLTEVVVPSEIESINGYAFRGMRYLQRVVLHSGITSLGGQCFRECPNLIEIDWNGLSLTTLSQQLFYMANISVYDITIPESVNMIDDEVFEHSLVRKIQLPGVTRIDRSAFRNCTLLEEISMPKIETIEYSSFEFCPRLKTVTMGNSKKTIDASAFAFCESLQEISIGLLTSLGNSPFAYSSSLTRIEVESESHTSVDGILYNKEKTELLMCPCGLSTISLIESTTAIGKHAFYGCHNLIEVIFNTGLQTISMSAFNDCKNLEKLQLPESVSSIGKHAFDTCYNLRTVLYCGTNAITSYGENAFSSKCDLYVVHDYPGDYFCGLPCIKGLDHGCMITTSSFTLSLQCRSHFSVRVMTCLAHYAYLVDIN